MMTTFIGFLMSNNLFILLIVRIPPATCTGMFTESMIFNIISLLFFPIFKAAFRSTKCNISTPSDSHFFATSNGLSSYTVLFSNLPLTNLTTWPSNRSIAAMLFHYDRLQIFIKVFNHFFRQLYLIFWMKLCTINTVNFY